MVAGPVGQGSLFQHQIAHDDPQHTLVVADRLDDLGSMPVQIIWGKQDAWQVVEWARKLHAGIPGSILRVLPDCGHFAIEDQPVALADFDIEFTAHHA